MNSLSNWPLQIGKKQKEQRYLPVFSCRVLGVWGLLMMVISCWSTRLMYCFISEPVMPKWQPFNSNYWMINTLVKIHGKRKKEIGSPGLHMATVEVTIQWKGTVEMFIHSHKCLHMQQVEVWETGNANNQRPFHINSLMKASVQCTYFFLHRKKENFPATDNYSIDKTAKKV